MAFACCVIRACIVLHNWCEGYDLMAAGSDDAFNGEALNHGVEEVDEARPNFIEREKVIHTFRQRLQTDE